MIRSLFAVGRHVWVARRRQKTALALSDRDAAALVGAYTLEIPGQPNIVIPITQEGQDLFIVLTGVTARRP